MLCVGAKSCDVIRIHNNQVKTRPERSRTKSKTDSGYNQSIRIGSAAYPTARVPKTCFLSISIRFHSWLTNYFASINSFISVKSTNSLKNGKHFSNKGHIFKFSTKSQCFVCTKNGDFIPIPLENQSIAVTLRINIHTYIHNIHNWPLQPFSQDYGLASSTAGTFSLTATPNDERFLRNFFMAALLL